MNIEIIGGDPAVNKAVQVRLATRGFTAAVRDLVPADGGPAYASPSPTPGLWAVGGHPHDGSGSAWREVVSTGGEFAPSFICTALAQDAALIAAAPETAAERDRLKASNAELLAALGWLMERAEAEVARLPDDARADLLQRACENARAAIAKAGGRTP